ncbi:discoidin domain-containing protein [Streptomyces himalayensis]|uniref:discoidin domain-containing protein n=1 Tax=Streptomyces himalayensis TaxID=2820085 RepID=UPI001C683B7A|nr:discoidin domain-containing protein [Streptomyces himalayensis]
MQRVRTLLLALVLALIGQAAVITALPAPQARAAIGASDFLKADGKYLKRNSGTGEIVTLRGTNLGGWLTFEDWMSPLGEFALDRTGWTPTASHNNATADSALDGDNTSRWNTGASQANGQWLQFDLGTPTLFNRAYVNAAGFSGDYPRGYRIEVSDDASTWKNVASGNGSQQNTSAAFSAQVARYVRVVQTGSSAGWWSVAEFNLFSDPVLHNGGFSASASSSEAGHPASAALDGDVNTRWTSGTAQVPDQWFTVDFGGTKTVNKILIDAGPASAGDYPRGYEILNSHDGTNWTKAASGSGSSRTTVVELFNSTSARYLRVKQTGSTSNWWSIAELGIYSGAEFDRTGWTVTASATESGGTPAKVKDGDAGTRWSTGAPQTGGQWLQVDMGATHTFNQIVLDTAKNSTEENDYPRGYTVQVSSDGSTWTQVAAGTGSRKATAINFAAARGRYVKITQTGTSANWWSVGEVNVYLNNDDYSMNLAYQKRFGATTAENLITTHQDTWITAADLDNIKTMGMNLIRLPIGWTELLNLDGTWKSNAWTKIDWLIAQAAQRDIYVLLDLHTVPGGGCPWGSCGRIGPNLNGFWTNTTYQDWAVDIWQQMATRYKGNPAVAGYDLINEPLLDYGEDADDVNQKSQYYDRLYDAVRAIDPDHTIYIAAFFGWNNITPPATHGWTNVAYELHPYDFAGGKDWNAQNNLVETQLADVAAKQKDPNWNVPVLYGEYSLYHFDDVWSKFMSGLNALNVSWTNWNYKVRGDHYNGAGGYWGFYNSNPSPVPVINNDTSATASAKIGQFGTGNFQPNTSFIETVSKFTGGEPWMATVPLDQTGWTASASATESGSSPANALDWNTGTRWSTGVSQADGQWFQVDMGSRQVFDQISFETRSGDQWDYPRGYRIQVSGDGSTWTTVKTGQGWGWKQAIPFAPQYARYVRITQTGSAHEWWSIAELHIYSEPALSRAAWTANASVTESGSSPANALDGNTTTRWSTGTGQATGQSYQIDLGTTRTFNRLLLDAHTSTGDYPRTYRIEVSTDGANWTTAATGNGTGAAVLAQFPVQTARHLKIALTGSSTSWWSIHELNLYGELERSRTGWTATASATEPGGAAGNALDSDSGTRWSIGAPQAAGQWFKADIGSRQWFNHLVLDSGTSTNDYPRGFTVEVSDDNTTWRTIANGEGTNAVTTVNFPITQARYIRVTLTKAAGSWWSIAELRVFE